MSRIHFSNVQLADDTDYFLYIGELKNYGLNLFLSEALTRIFNRKFGFVAVVPDIFEQYNYDNLVVINPQAGSEGCRYGPNYSCRVSAQAFMTCVSQSRQIEALVRQLLNRQQALYIYMYESLPEMTLDRIPGVRILGPDPAIAHREYANARHAIVAAPASRSPLNLSRSRMKIISSAREETA